MIPTRSPKLPLPPCAKPVMDTALPAVSISPAFSHLAARQCGLLQALLRPTLSETFASMLPGWECIAVTSCVASSTLSRPGRASEALTSIVLSFLGTQRCSLLMQRALGPTLLRMTPGSQHTSPYPHRSRVSGSPLHCSEPQVFLSPNPCPGRFLMAVTSRGLSLSPY